MELLYQFFQFFVSLFSGYLGIFIFVGSIIFTAAICLILELRSVFSYKNREEFSTIRNAIEILSKYKNKDWIESRNVDNKNVFTWLIKYLDGEIVSGRFRPKKQDQYFLLFSYPTILIKSVPRSPVYFAPTLLTALGILGTFTGIFAGLQGIDLNTISNNQNLLDASIKLLSGMKLAFVTSLFGLSCASLFMIILSMSGSDKQKFRNSIYKKLNNIAYVESSAKILSRLDPNSSQNDDQKIEKSLAQISSSLAQLSLLTPQSISAAIKESLSSEENLLVKNLIELKQQNHKYLLPISQDLQIIREIQENQKQTVELLVQQLRQELIEPVVERLDQSANLTRDASLAVRELKNELGGIAQSLAGAVETIQSFQKDTLQKLQEFAGNLQDILAEFRTDTQGVMQQVATEINQAVEQSIAGMEAQRGAFEASANKASETFRGIREDLQQALDTQAEQQKQMLREVSSSTEQILVKANEAFQNQSDTLTTVGQEASMLLNQAKDNLLGTLNNIDTMLQNTRETVQTELESFRLDYQNALQQFFNEQNNLLNETLGKQREGLSEVVNNLQQAFLEEAERRQAMSEQVNQSLNKISATMTEINKLATAIGLNSSERLAQLQELARTIGNEAAQVENSYRQLTGQFNQALQQMNQSFDLALNNGNEQLSNYLEKAQSTYANNLKEFDKFTANIYSNLNESSSGLMSVAEYLVAAANELKNNKN
ncbi:MAG: hypothetical protein VKJ02_00430 [Snowella sp.]|nr:hypothetical protein [Snowella sp.]